MHKRPDYDFLACRIMKEFGWTIEYVLSLSFPVFFDLFGLIRRVRCDSAIDQVYLPYAAAKYGGKCQRNLFDGRGSFFLNTTSSGKAPKGYTRAELKAAEEKARRIIEEHEKALNRVAGASVDA